MNTDPKQKSAKSQNPRKSAVQTKKGYQHTKLGWIPEDWDTLKLGELGNFLKGKGISKSELLNEGFPCLTYGELYTAHHFIINKFGSFINDESAKLSQELQYGDILFTGSGETLEEIGKCAAYINKFKAYAGGDIIILRQNGFDPYFLGYVLNHDIVNRQKYRLGQGHSIVHIYSRNLKEVEVPIPPLPEQKAIARVLSTWDTAIELLTRLIAQKELRKKWLMQYLLTGEKRLPTYAKASVGKPEFSGEWGEVNLSDLFERVTRKNTERNTNVVTISAQRGFIKQTDFFNKKVASDILDNYFLVKKGEFCYNKSYSTGYPKGATKRLIDFEKAVVTTLYICFGIKDENVSNGDFFEQYFEANYLDRGLTKIAHEGGRAHGLLNVTPSDFFSLRITVPPFEEQTAIARVLQAADKELTLLKTKAEKLKGQKKGLMQILLTGKKRLNYDSFD